MKDEMCGLVSFYQDRAAGERLLENFKEHGIPSRWIDSRREGFPQLNNSDVSTDGLAEIIESFPNTKLIRYGLSKPGEAFNVLFREAADFKYTITMGCDEYLEGDYPLLLENLDRIPMMQPTKLRLPLVEHNLGGTNWGGHITERIVYLPAYVHIKQVHWIYFHNYFGYDTPLATKKRESPLALGMILHHDDTIRESWRNQIMDQFQKTQRKEERQALYSMIEADII